MKQLLTLIYYNNYIANFQKIILKKLKYLIKFIYLLAK